MRLLPFLAVACLLAAGCSSTAPAPAPDLVTVRIAAAADLRPAFDELLPAFERASGYRTLVSYGSSGNFYQQLQNGAPHDVFFSADVAYAQRLADASLTDGGPTSYAVGRLVFWTAAPEVLAWFGHPPTVHNVGIPRTLAIANPEHAPYGRAAVAALGSPELARLRLLQRVTGDNVAHALQMAESGAADAALVALSLVLSPNAKTGGYKLIPADAHPPIEQAVVVARNGRTEGAHALVQYVNSPAGREVMARFGFEPPSKP